MDVIVYQSNYKNITVLVLVAGIDKDGNKRLLQLRWILLLSLITGLLTTVVTGYLFSSRLLMPIRRIADDVNEISAQCLARRIAETGVKDEWNYL